MAEDGSKDQWPRVAFGDIVKLNRERINDPEANGFDRYVGLDHMDPGELKVRRWGNVSDGTTFTSVFRTGQVLFGKRRAYQRKVAVADFDGICSGDIYVFEPKNSNLLPELLPFICRTDEFFEHAVGTSAGSLSPRTNWDSLANYELRLPPLNEQRRMSRILWANELLRRAHQNLVFNVRLTRRSLAKLLFEETSLVVRKRLGDFVLESAYGPRFPSAQYVKAGNAWTIRTTDFVSDGSINYDSVPSARLDEGVVSDHRLRDGDFLLSRSGEYAGMVRVFDALAAPGKAFIPAAFLIRFRLDKERLLPQFLLEYLQSPLGESIVRNMARGSAQPNISGSAFMLLEIPVPDIETQRKTCQILNKVKCGEFLSSERVLAATRLAANLSENLFSIKGK